MMNPVRDGVLKIHSSGPSLPTICVCPTIPHSVLTTPATAIMVGSKPIKGSTIKNGNFDNGPNQACLKDTAKFISSLE